MNTSENNYKIVKQLLFAALLIIGLLLVSNYLKVQEVTNNELDTNYVNVKYRNSSVDLTHGRWEYLKTTGSSLVSGAWYDQANNYMIINLKGTYYHYCGFDRNTWELFKSSESFGTFYTTSIKGAFDCRNLKVPIY